MKRVAVVTLLAAAAAGPALAQDTVDERRPAAAEGSVVIDSPGGPLRVVGWDRNEVAVSGTLSADAELEVRSDERTTRVEVVGESHHPMRAHASLEIKVPARSRVSVESFGGSITVSGVRGSVRGESVNGSIDVDEIGRAHV